MNKSLQRFEMTVPLGSLEAYIHSVNQIPLLTAEEEYQLATEYQRHGNLEAAKRLVLPHLRFVVRVARGYSGYGLQQSDLIQEGNIGLMKAVKRFKPEVGVRLVSFAVHWIRAEIHEFILRNWRIVKVVTTKELRKLFFKFRKAAKRLGWLSNEEADVIAKDLNVSRKAVLEMQGRLNKHDEAFDGPMNDSQEEWATAPSNYLEDHRYNPERYIETMDWSDQREQRLRQALTSLDLRSQDILQQRWLADQKATLHDLASKYNVSAERIRQLEKNAMNKLKKAINDFQ